MARKAFAGDNEYRLPKGKIEPYRLWFEYLKLAKVSQRFQIDEGLYSPWGDVSVTDFDIWWKKNWKPLFGIRASTRLIKNAEDYALATKDPTVVVLRVSISDTKKTRLKDINDALMGLRIAPTDGKKGQSRPAFDLSSKRSMNFKTLRGMLKFLELYHAKDLDIEAASLAYFRWSRGWNEKVRAKKWKRPSVYEPTFLRRFVDEIEKKRASKRKGLKLLDERGAYKNLRSQAMRFIRKGEKILSNVAVGRFPGAF